MKVLVFILVLANLLFFAYTKGYFGRPDNPDAVRIEQQLNAERIQIKGVGEAPPGAPAAKKDKRAAADTPAAQACAAWNVASDSDADKLTALLNDKFADFKRTTHATTAESGSWWVFIPPLPSKSAADKKASELKRAGVNDFYIVQDNGPNRFAISLGVFSGQAGATEHLAKLKAKGIVSAQAKPRNGADSMRVIEARGAASQVAPLRDAVAAAVPDSRPQACE